MTIPTTIPTGGHPADREMTELQKAVIALLSFLSGGTGAVGNNGDILGVSSSIPAWQASPRAAFFVSGNQAGITNFPVASGFLDLPLATTGANGYTGKSISRNVRARLSFSAFTDGASQMSVKCLVDSVATGGTLNFFYNPATQHMAWSFVWNLGALAAGAHTIKVQMSTNGALRTGTVNTDDYVTFEVDEVG